MTFEARPVPWSHGRSASRFAAVSRLDGPFRSPSRRFGFRAPQHCVLVCADPANSQKLRAECEVVVKIRAMDLPRSAEEVSCSCVACQGCLAAQRSSTCHCLESVSEYQFRNAHSTNLHFMRIYAPRKICQTAVQRTSLVTLLTTKSSSQPCELPLSLPCLRSGAQWQVQSARPCRSTCSRRAASGCFGNKGTGSVSVP
jgi:hypothetical protein